MTAPAATLLHGDVLDVLPGLAGRDFAVVVADPPYCSGGMQATGRVKPKHDVRYNPHRDRWILGDQMSTEVYREWLRAVLRLALNACRDSACAFVFTDWRMWPVVQHAGEAGGWTTAQMVVWDKVGKGLGHFWMNQHELVWCGFKNRRRHPPGVGRGNVVAERKPREQAHPNAKPPRLIEALLASVAVEGGVLDPFAGGGSTGIAARQAGREFTGIDVDGEWVEQARRNLQMGLMAA